MDSEIRRGCLFYRKTAQNFTIDICNEIFGERAPHIWKVWEENGKNMYYLLDVIDLISKEKIIKWMVTFLSVDTDIVPPPSVPVRGRNYGAEALSNQPVSRPPRMGGSMMFGGAPVAPAPQPHGHHISNAFVVPSGPRGREVLQTPLPPRKPQTGIDLFILAEHKRQAGAAFDQMNL